jgi:hypothetical protein
MYACANVADEVWPNSDTYSCDRCVPQCDWYFDLYESQSACPLQAGFLTFLTNAFLSEGLIWQGMLIERPVTDATFHGGFFVRTLAAQILNSVVVPVLAGGRFIEGLSDWLPLGPSCVDAHDGLQRCQAEGGAGWAQRLNVGGVLAFGGGIHSSPSTTNDRANTNVDVDVDGTTLEEEIIAVSVAAEALVLTHGEEWTVLRRFYASIGVILFSTAVLQSILPHVVTISYNLVRAIRMFAIWVSVKAHSAGSAGSNRVVRDDALSSKYAARVNHFISVLGSVFGDMKWMVKLREDCVRQCDLNEWFLPTPLLLPQLFCSTCLTLAAVFVFSGTMPLLNIVGALAFFLKYQIERFFLCKYKTRQHSD